MPGSYGKDQLFFDPLDKDNSDGVAAYVRSSESGALITNHSFVRTAGVDTFVDGDVTVGDDSINSVAHGYTNGELVQLTTDGVLPAGLAAATDYFIIRVDDDNYKLAANAKDAEDTDILLAAILQMEIALTLVETFLTPFGRTGAH